MKRPETARRGGIKWDEQNLETNEKIKAELNAVKINEPKTPYHGPLGEEHLEEDELLHLNLDGHAPVVPAGANGHSPIDAAGPSTSNGGSMEVDHAATTERQTAEATASLQVQHPQAQPAQQQFGRDSGGWISSGYNSLEDEREQKFSRVSIEGDPGRVSFSGHSATSNSGGGGGDEGQHKHFEATRKAHYNMRMALQKAKELLSEDPDEVEEPPEDKSVQQQQQEGEGNAEAEG